MSAELATRTFTTDEVNLVKQTICKGATDTELALFLQQCKRTGLDPFSRQIHAVKRWDATQGREVMTMQTGIDGFRLIAERTGKYAGNDDPQYDREDAQHPNKATVTVWKLVEGQRVPFTRSARWSEFVQTKKGGEVTRFWAKMPYLMLGKVAEALALRAAFPQELSGLYTSDEMGQADDGEHIEQPRVLADLKQIPGVKTAADLRNIDAELMACADLESLRVVFMKLTPEQRARHAAAKDKRKAELEPKKLTAATISELIASVAVGLGEDETDLIGAMFAAVLRDADSLDTATPEQLARADKWLRERAVAA